MKKLIIILFNCLLTFQVFSQFDFKYNKGHADGIYKIAITSDNRFIISVSSNTLMLSELQSGRELWSVSTENHGKVIGNLKIVGEKIFVSTPNGIKIYEFDTGKLISTFCNTRGQTSETAFSHDGTLTTTYHYSNEDGNYIIGIWDTHSGKLTARIKEEVREIRSLCISKNKKYLYTGDRQGNIFKWDIQQQTKLSQFIAHESWVETLVLTSDDNILVSGSSKGKISIWDTENDQLISSIDTETYSSNDFSICISPDDKSFWACGESHSIKIYSLPTGEMLEEISNKKYDFRGLGRGSNFIDYASDFLIQNNITYFTYKNGIVSINHNTKEAGLVLGSNTSGISKIRTYKNSSGDHLVFSLAGQVNNWEFSKGFNKKVIYNGSVVTDFDISKTSGRLGTTDGMNLFFWNLATKKKLGRTGEFNDRYAHLALLPNEDHVIAAAEHWPATGKKLVKRNVKTDEILNQYGSNSLIITDAKTSPGGKYLSARTWKNGSVLSWNAETTESLNSSNRNVSSFQFTSDSILVLGYQSKIQEINLDTKTPIKTTNFVLPNGERGSFRDFNFTNDREIFFGLRKNVEMWDYQTGTLLRIFEHDVVPISFDLSDDEKQLIVSYTTGEINIWDLSAKSKEPAVTIQALKNEEDWLITAPIPGSKNKYFSASKNASKEVYYVDGFKTYGFDQFDLIYNRPDIILDKIGYATPEVIEVYRRAYIKRLKRMGFDQPTIDRYIDFNQQLDLNAPLLTIGDELERFLITDKSSISIPISAYDPKGFDLDRLMVNVNDVPIYGVSGLNLENNDRQKLAKNLDVSLSEGKNIIGIRVLNDQGIYSYEETIEVVCEANFAKPDLHIVSIGVSKYSDSNFNLNFAAKDANDMANFFASSSSYDQVKKYVLTDEKVSTTSIIMLKEQLLDSDVNDQVIIFYAGHGVLDSKYDYYLSTYDMDFGNAPKAGLPYQSLEDLLDGIPARNKLMLIDACHSGELDKDEVEVASVTKKISNLTFRGFGAYRNKITQSGLPNSFELMKNLFNDISSSTGAVVVSSAGGVEFAYESPEWNNGVFTYALLEGMQSKKIDENNDKRVQVNELKLYVFGKVRALTGGMQNPTARQENLENDYTILKF